MAHDFNRFPELTNAQAEIYYLESPHKQIFEDFEGKVERVIDGDTVMMSWKERGFEFPVRLLNINAPEMNEGGKESKEWLKDQIEELEVIVEISPKQRVGKFGRILGTIISDGININQQSLAFGFSRPFGEEVGAIPDFNNELRRAEF